MNLQRPPAGLTPVAGSLDPERVAFESAQLEPSGPVFGSPRAPIHIELSTAELIIGLAALAVWFGLFSGGILVATEPYRRAIENPTVSGELVVNWVVVLAFWTITNIGVLSCIAAFLGALGNRTKFTSDTDTVRSPASAGPASTRGLATYYMSAVMRGFGVYSLVLAGLLVFATDSLISPDQAAYMRLAPTVSIISFYAGYDPSIFAGLLDRVKNFLQAGTEKGN